MEQRGGGKEGGREEGSFIIAAAGDGGDGDGRQYTLGKFSAAPSCDRSIEFFA